MCKKLDKKIYAIILAAVLVVSAGCCEHGSSSEAVSDKNRLEADVSGNLIVMPQSLDDLLFITNNRRSNIVKPDTDDLSFLRDWGTGQANQRWPGGAGVRIFSEDELYSLEEVEMDIEILFDVFKNAYGPYYYFGGDNAFNRAKGNILLEIRGQDSLSGHLLEDIIIEQLSFIRDGHCAINDRPFQNTIYSYVCPNVAFALDSVGFFNQVDGKRVADIDGDEEFQEHMKLSFDTAGELVYRYIVTTDKPRRSKITYTDGTKDTLLLAKIPASHPDLDAPPVTLEYVNGIPVIRIHEMGFDHTQDDGGAKLFLQYAEEFAEAPVLIVDLRTNGGGNGILPRKWMDTFTGEMVPTNFYTLRRTTVGGYFGYREPEESPDSAYYIPTVEIDHYLPRKSVPDAWQLESFQDDKLVPHKGLLILLVGKYTCSAAETFVDLAYNVENTVVIGTNTFGMLRSQLFSQISMPNTGIKLSIGDFLTQFPDDYFEEFVGFEPDIWAVDDAEKSAILYLEKYLD